MRPQFGSPPWTAVLTRLDDATARAAVRASPSEAAPDTRSEEHTSELQSQSNLVCRLLLEKKNSEFVGDHLHVTLSRWCRPGHPAPLNLLEPVLKEDQLCLANEASFAVEVQKR